MHQFQVWADIKSLHKRSDFEFVLWEVSCVPQKCLNHAAVATPYAMTQIRVWHLQCTPLQLAEVGCPALSWKKQPVKTENPSFFGSMVSYHSVIKVGSGLEAYLGLGTCHAAQFCLWGPSFENFCVLACRFCHQRLGSCHMLGLKLETSVMADRACVRWSLQCPQCPYENFSGAETDALQTGKSAILSIKILDNCEYMHQIRQIIFVKHPFWGQMILAKISKTSGATEHCWTYGSAQINLMDFDAWLRFSTHHPKNSHQCTKHPKQ